MARGPTTLIAAWVRRYGTAELAGTGAALASAHAAIAVTGSELAAAYGGTLGENIGFYGMLFAQRILADRGAAWREHRWYRARDLARTAANLVIEVGPAEVADTLATRPLAMAAGTRVFGTGWGVLIGKLVADLLFYLAVISAHELRCLAARAGSGRRE